MTDTQPYNKRLTGNDDPDTLVELGETIAAELGERHYDECYEAPICQDCIRDTPLEGERAEWAEKTAELEAAIAAVEHRLESLDGEPSRTLRPWMNGSYWEGFVFGAIPSVDCEVCPDDR